MIIRKAERLQAIEFGPIASAIDPRFSSEVGTGSCEENASKQESTVDAGGAR